MNASVDSINGIGMAYELRGDGEPLVLLHGFTGCGGDWVHVFDLDELARRHRLIIPDARGHGRSTNPAGTFTHRQCALDTLALLDRLGVARFKAVGASLGGNTLLHMATLAPERVAAMVLVSATPYYPKQARAIMAAVTDEGHSPDEWQMMRARHAHGDGQIRALWRHANGFKDSYDDLTFTPPHLATIRARTLIVYGDRDPLYPVELALEMYRAIPDAALWVVPGGGHGPIYGAAEREAFARAASVFLEA
jgi:pimeloyl-ACP methyl ester carboxylesterase